VDVPEGLRDGVAIIEALNHLKPGSIEKYEKTPKNIFSKATNIKLINEALIKLAIDPQDLPNPNDVSSGKSDRILVGLIARITGQSSSKTLEVAPEAVVKEKQIKFETIQKTRKERSAKKIERGRQAVKATIRAARYEREYRVLRTQPKILQKEAAKHGSFYVPPEPKVAFVLRLRGINGVPPTQKKILQLFRLRQIQNGVFVKINKATLNMLKKIEPYVAIGYPSVGIIKKLLLKRGYGKQHKQRVPLTSNAIISAGLGQYNVHTLDDLVHEIATVGKNFTKCNRFLWPFKMNSPRGGYGRSKLRHFAEGGHAGNRMHLINSFIKRLL
ncbi:MAG: putative 60S ribosomal protein L7, partial [Streblomastix strix]